MFGTVFGVVECGVIGVLTFDDDISFFNGFIRITDGIAVLIWDVTGYFLNILVMCH